MSNYNINKKGNRYNDESQYYNKNNQVGKRSTVDDNKIKIIGKRPELNKNIHQLAYTLFSHKQIGNM